MNIGTANHQWLGPIGASINGTNKGDSMTTEVINRPQIAAKNESAWTKSGVAVTATSASDVARQAGLDHWTPSRQEFPM